MWLVSQVGRLCGLAAVVGISMATAPVVAQQTRDVIIGNDRGGVIAQQVEAIRRIRAQGQRVVIRGPMCLSSCTMYLGSGNVCVDPRATLGFHGPSSYGRPLTRPDFERWSRIIAGHYPDPLKGWFMSTARHRIKGYHRLSGAQLIRMGVEQC